MSLTHGHFYAAEKIIEGMSDPVKSIVTKYIKEYRLGAIGHDLVGWTDDAARLNFGDLHSSRTSRLVESLLEVAIGAYIANNEKDPVAVNENGDPILAFALGWMTHWATDLYIHSLVNKYGGDYNKDRSKHVQLELVETKYIHEKHKQKIPNVDTWTIEYNNAIWAYLNHALCVTYSKDGINYEEGKEQGKINDLTKLNYIGYLIMVYAFEAAEKGCTSKNKETTFYWELTKLASHFSSRPAFAAFLINLQEHLADMVTLAWASKDAYVPSNNTYRTIMNPLKITVVPKATHLDVHIEIEDTGLYGKFLADYESFIDGAVDKGASIANAINEYLVEFEKNPRKENDARNNYETRLKPIIFDTRNTPGNADINLDILFPEMRILTDNAKTIEKIISAPPDYYNTHRKDLYYEVEFNLGGQVLPAVIEREIVNPIMEKNRIYGSDKAVSDICIPIENPQSLPYAYKLKISLTDEKAFTYPQYENIEYKYLEGIYIDIAFIKNCTSIEVGYYGPVRRDETIEGKVIRSDARCTIREYTQYPFFTMVEMAANRTTPVTEFPRSSFVVDKDKDGKDGQNVNLCWADCEFTAEINAGGNNETVSVAMPGSPSTEVKPEICGKWANTIKISGKVDFETQTVKVQATETRHDERKDEFNDYKSDFIRTFSAENLHLTDCDEDGSMACFGVSGLTAMRESTASYDCTDTCTGRPYSGKARDIRDTIDLEGDGNEDRFLYIKFCQ